MRDAQRVVVIVESHKYRNPFEIWALIALCISAGLYLFGFPTSNSVTQVLPQWSTTLWAFMLFTGPLFTLFGMFWNQAVTGRTIQIAGHLWTGTGSLIYSSVLLYYLGAPAIMTGLTVGSIAVASAFRIRQLRQKIRAILQKTEEQSYDGDHNYLDVGGE